MKETSTQLKHLVFVIIQTRVYNKHVLQDAKARCTASSGGGRGVESSPSGNGCLHHLDSRFSHDSEYSTTGHPECMADS